LASERDARVVIVDGYYMFIYRNKKRGREIP